MQFKDLGWEEFFEKGLQALADKELIPARVLLMQKELYRVSIGDMEYWAKVRGKFRHEAKGIQDYPNVGDFVAIKKKPDEKIGTIYSLLPRKTKLSRKIAGQETEEQVLAANVDIVFLVLGLDQEIHARRLERFLTMISQSGAQAVILLSKKDLVSDMDASIKQVQMLAPQVSVHAISVPQKEGISIITTYVTPGKTIVLLGASGAGKSTLINYLLGQEIQKVNKTRESDAQGRHTTTYRELFVLPQGGMVIDTPGLREIQLWDAEPSVPVSFDDIDELSKQCRFRDCEHRTEPGCAVQESVMKQGLSKERLEHFHTLHAEMKRIATLTEEQERWKNKRSAKVTNKAIHQFYSKDSKE